MSVQVETLEKNMAKLTIEVPAEELEAFNRHIVGRIEVIARFLTEQGV